MPCRYHEKSEAGQLEIFAMPEETGEAECALTIEKPISRVHCDHYGDVKGCECVQWNNNATLWRLNPASWNLMDSQPNW